MPMHYPHQRPIAQRPDPGRHLYMRPGYAYGGMPPPPSPPEVSEDHGIFGNRPHRPPAPAPEPAPVPPTVARPTIQQKPDPALPTPAMPAAPRSNTYPYEVGGGSKRKMNGLMIERLQRTSAPRAPSPAAVTPQRPENGLPSLPSPAMSADPAAQLQAAVPAANGPRISLMRPGGMARRRQGSNSPTLAQQDFYVPRPYAPRN